MKTRVYIGLLLMVLTVAIYGCTKNDHLLDESVSEVKRSATRIDKESALENLENLIHSLHPQTKSTQLKIADVYSVGMNELGASAKSATGEHVDSLLYIVNFENQGGYAVLAADTRIPADVLAIVEHGEVLPSDFSDTSDEENFPLQLMASYAMNGLNTTWFDTLANNNDLDNPNPPKDLGSYWRTEVVVSDKVETMLSNYWHQKSPFNDFRHDDAPAGCVPIAATMIFAYNAYPPIISHNGRILNLANIANYKYYPFNATQSADLSALVEYVSDPMNINYGDSSSGANAGKAMKFFNKAYKNAKKHQKYDLDLILGMLRTDRPVYIECLRGLWGSGHAWVISGTFLQTVYQREYENETNRLLNTYGGSTRYLHCNWGHGGNNNGYYESGMLFWEKAPKIADSQYSTSNGEYSGNPWSWRIITYDKP